MCACGVPLCIARRFALTIVEDDASVRVHHARAEDQVDRRCQGNGTSLCVDDRQVSGSMVVQVGKLGAVVWQVVGAILR